MADNEYPKAMYKGAEVRTVQNKEEETALGSGWEDGNTFFGRKVAEGQAKSQPQAEAKPAKKSSEEKP